MGGAWVFAWRLSAGPSATDLAWRPMRNGREAKRQNGSVGRPTALSADHRTGLERGHRYSTHLMTCGCVSVCGVKQCVCTAHLYLSGTSV